MAPDTNYPDRDPRDETIATLRQQLAAAIAERDRAVKDAERYSLLRGEANQNTAHDIYGNGGYWRIGLHSSDNRLTLDAAIDAAIAPGGDCPFYSGGECTCGNDQHPWIGRSSPAIAPGGHDWRTDGGGIDYCSRCGKGKKSVANRPCAADKGVDAAGGAHE